MLVAERREILLNRLRADGKLVAHDLAIEFGISEDSVRRDLRELAAAGLCQRVYGGAVPVSRALVDYRSRASVEPESKARIAARAVELIGEGDRVILDGGTTTLAVARALPLTLNATVITHSPTIATQLVGHPTVEILLLGGRIYKHSAVACGATTAEAAQSISADLFFLGVTGVHPEYGLTTGDAEEAAMKRTLAGRAADTYVLASSEKIGAVSAYKVLDIDAAAGIVTDATADADALQELERVARALIISG
jgi:DeoR/GlpR family transcriptional regulator of sugar metabolism